MDDSRFYVLFNSVSVISGRCLDENERLCAMELRLRYEINVILPAELYILKYRLCWPLRAVEFKQPKITIETSLLV